MSPDVPEGQTRRPGPLLLHGFTGSAAVWDRVRAGLADRGFEPRALDLPGHGTRGSAPRDDYRLASVLAEIGASGPWPGDLVGYSMGGRIALHFAVERPEAVRRLVLESSSPGLDDPIARAERSRADAALAARLRTEGISSFVAEWEALPLFASQASLPEAVRSAHRELRLGNDASGLALALRWLGTGTLPSLWDRLGEVTAETLLLVGEHDGKFRGIARRMARRLSAATVFVVEGAGHATHLERPEAWLDAVSGFLGRPDAP